MFKLVDEFIEYLSVMKGYSEETTKNYKLDLYLFCDYLKDNNIKSYRDVSYNFLRTYLIYLTNEKEYSNKSIARHISSLHTFFEYLLENDVIKNNPMNLINSPKKQVEKHHIFPKNYLKTDFKLKQVDFNQIANMIYIHNMAYFSLYTKTYLQIPLQISFYLFLLSQ